MPEEIAPSGIVLQLLAGRAGIEAGAMPLIRLQAKLGKGEPVMVLPELLAGDFL